MLQPKQRRITGFTLIELLVTLSIIALLLTIVAPRYFKSVDKAQEAVLKQDLNIMRDALDKFYADQGRYPNSLNELVDRKYLRSIPVDPVTQSNDSWQTVAPTDGESGNVFDVKSGAEGTAHDGTAYRDW